MTDNLPASAGNPPTGTPISGNKELENAPAGAAEVPFPKETVREELPKEVTSAGVTIHPTTIPVPPSVADMGVQSAGANIPMPTAAATLPISDDQIARGLGKSIRESFRWLAEWCIRRLKQAHIGLQSVRGRLIRVTTHA